MLIECNDCGIRLHDHCLVNKKYSYLNAYDSEKRSQELFTVKLIVNKGGLIFEIKELGMKENEEALFLNWAQCLRCEADLKGTPEAPTTKKRRKKSSLP